MAEAVGLAFGGVALVGLFSTCLEIVDYVANARAHRPSAALSATQVALLRTRLSQWGERLSITSPGGEHEILRQRWPEESRIIIDSLIGIKRLFDHSAELIGKHVASFSDPSGVGLPATANTKLLRRQPSTPVVVLSHKNPNRSVLWRGLLARILLSVRWALNDKTELDSCINQLEFFVTNLEKVCKRLTDSDDLQADSHQERDPDKMPYITQEQATTPRGQQVGYLNASLSPQENRAMATRQPEPNQQSRNASYGAQNNPQIHVAHAEVHVERDRSNHWNNQTSNEVYEDNISRPLNSTAITSVGPLGDRRQISSRGDIYRRNQTESGVHAHVGPIDVNALSIMAQMQKQAQETQIMLARLKK